jgi:recA bacterial DNA recombination protein
MTAISLLRPNGFQIEPAQICAAVVRGHELTLKHRRLSSGIGALDAILDGGLARGRISEIVGQVGSGRTTIGARFVAAATRAGEVVAWIEESRSFAPADIAAGSANLDRVLWASVSDRHGHGFDSAGRFRRYRFSAVFKAAELVLKAGGFGLVVIDSGVSAPLPQNIALRLAREAERSGTAVVVIAPHRICGTFAALSLKLTRLEVSFNRLTPASPAVFDGCVIHAATVHNKLGRTGGSAILCGAIDPLASLFAGMHRSQAGAATPLRLDASNA